MFRTEHPLMWKEKQAIDIALSTSVVCGIITKVGSKQKNAQQGMGFRVTKVYSLNL